MTSSMLVGERRWASARRSGMTVLGKVAVPRPINLPSQRLENHGLDPNVEIVPKGTLSWGTQSSSAPTVWGSTAPNADGNNSSPGHLSAQPSSGSGSRPSTASSDRTRDLTPNAWGPSSRPSSASGALTANSTALTSLRPRSAETRPGSSQLSRFAEPPSDNSVLRGPTGFSSKLGVTSSNKNEFSLSSGDFPTLGSEKDNHEYGYGSRPGSSCSRPASEKEKNITPLIGNVKSETLNFSTSDGSQHAEHGVQPIAEKWQGDIPPCANPDLPPQHFDSWHGPPLSHPPGVWYRGPPGGPPYGAPLSPGGFPIEPFPFYHPQMPTNNLQPVPSGTRPRGHNVKTGELCRPRVPEAFIHPRMPINPGFYPAPVSYDGYYGPPMAYCNPNECDMSFMRMPASPPVYKRHPCEDAVDARAKSPVHGSRGKPLPSERMGLSSGHSDDARGPYKVILKQSNDWGEKQAEEEWEHAVPSHIPYKENRGQPRTLLQNNEWGLEGNEGKLPLDSAKLSGSRGKADGVVDSLGNKLENESPSFPYPSEVVSATPKDPTLIQKIDGLNAKVRILEGRPDVATLPCREDRYNQPHQSGTIPFRRPSQGEQGRHDHRGKRLNNQDADGWRKKLLAAESSTEVSVTISETSSTVLHDHHGTMASGKSGPNLQCNDERSSSALLFDESDTLAQRALMREIAKQHAERLQKEEEERTREQKAKALAKLQELNRRTHIAEISSEKSEKAPPVVTAQQEEEESRKCIESNIDSSKLNTLRAALVQNHEEQIRANNSIMVGENTVVFEGTIFEKSPKSELPNCEAAPEVSEAIVSKHKRTDDKQRQSMNLAKGVTKKSVPVTQAEEPNVKTANDAAHSESIAVEVVSSDEPSLQINSDVMTESSTHHKRKNNRSNKNKHKVVEVAHVAAVQSTESKEATATKISTEKVDLDTNLLQTKAVKHTTQDSRQHPSEGTGGKGVSHQWKPLQSRRMPRNQQANSIIVVDKLHGTDAVIAWAPLRSQNKIDVVDKPGDKVEIGTEIANANTDSVLPNNMKTKRAEMERYIPKPVAQELAQQGSIQQQPVLSQNIVSVQHGDSTIMDEGPTAELKNGESNQIKPLKPRGLWRERSSIQAAHTSQGLQEAGMNVHKPIEQDQPLLSDISSSLKDQTKSSNDLNTTDGWDSTIFSDPVASDTSAVTKGQRSSVRGRRHPIKGHRSTGNNSDLDHGIANTGPSNTLSSQSFAAPEMMNQKNNALKENRHGGQRTSQWQPKSQQYSVNNHRNKSSEGLMDADAKTHVESGENVLHSHADRSLSEPMNVVEAQNVVHQDIKRERKAASFRGRPHSPNLSGSNPSEHNQHFSSGFRKNGNNNNRSGRGHDPCADASFNREKPRQSSHFEYQPIGQYGNNKPHNLEDPIGSSLNTGSKSRVRNHGRPRRGGDDFYGRQSGTTRGDGHYD